jgi:hypothetical protein
MIFLIIKDHGTDDAFFGPYHPAAIEKHSYRIIWFFGRNRISGYFINDHNVPDQFIYSKVLYKLCTIISIDLSSFHAVLQ